MNLKQEIRAYLEATGMKPYRLGLLACANNYAVDRVLAGTGSVDSLQQILDYMKANPPKAADKGDGD